MSSPTISVVIPLYNHGRFIAPALESVLSQTSPADEIVLIDDGSSDEGFTIASGILSSVSYAKVFKQRNVGAHRTINRAISFSNGDYIAVLNSDDSFIRTKLGRCRDLLREDTAPCLISGAVGVMDDRNERQASGITIDWLKRGKNFLLDSGLPLLSLLNENYIGTTSNMVFSRKLWESAGGFQPLRYCHDLDFLSFAYRMGPVVYDAECEHILYRVHQNNTIKEDLASVRTEIAAVIASAFVLHGPRLLLDQKSSKGLDFFMQFLHEKRLSELVCFFQTIFPGFCSRTEFYRYATDPGRIHDFAKYTV